MSNAEMIQAVINTLKLLEMPPTYDNVDRMTGIYKTLCRVRDDLYQAETQEEKGEQSDGEDKAE